MRHALDLFSFQGRVSRRAYLLAGVLLFALKYPVDLLIARANHHTWNPLMYLSWRVSPLFDYQRDPLFVLELLIWAVPFIWAGVSLTARRMRDVGIHPFWAGTFFLPFLHVAVFGLLGIAPSTVEPAAPPTPDAGPFRASVGPPLPVARAPRFLTRVIPRGAGLAYLFALVTSLAMGLACYVITVQLSSALGTGLFIGLPFGIAFWMAFVMTWERGMRFAAAWGYACSAIAIALVVLLAVGWEGVACLIMASPLLFGVATLGALVGWVCARQAPLRTFAPAMLLMVPLLVGADVVRARGPERLSVSSSVTVHAPPDVVWRNVIAFPPIDEPPPPIFAMVAMPVEARLDGHDPGATRRCIFTNGTFVEPIETWDPPRELTFAVTAQPPHLDEYFDDERGQFLIHDNGDGTTTLTGTTWYRLHVFPTAYWSLWSQKLLHAIHLRVLEHIKHLSEQPPSQAQLAPPSQQPAWMQSANQTCACTRHKSQAQ